MLGLMKRHSRESILSALRNDEPVLGVLRNLEQYYTQFFEQHADSTMKPIMDSILKESKINVQQAAGANFVIDEMPANVQQLVDQVYQQNKKFVMSLPGSYIDKMREPVTDFVASRAGTTLSDVISAVKQASEFTGNRAHREAMDLVRGAYQGVAIERAKSTGAKTGIWIHAYGKGGNPRHRHLQANGEEFDLNTGIFLTGPLKGQGAGYGDDDSERVQPGEAKYCHCTFKLKIDFGVQ